MIKLRQRTLTWLARDEYCKCKNNRLPDKKLCI
jgi:hypothetical protein